MDKKEPAKKTWSAPKVLILDIKKDTSSGSRPGRELPENNEYSGPPGLS